MSIGLDINTYDMRRLQTKLLAASRVNVNDMLEGVGAEVENQTRRRVQDEKTAPDGKPWADWSEKYAASKHGASKGHDPHPGSLRDSQGHTILSLDGGLHDSLQSLVTFDEVEIGSNLVYANFQNNMRQFIGLSSDDNAEVIAVIEDFLDREMRIE